MSDQLNPSKIANIAEAILTDLEENCPANPYEKMAALRTAAHTVENVIAAKALQSAIVAGITNVIKPRQ